MNVPHNYVEQGKAVGAVVAHALQHQLGRVELTEEEQQKWVELIMTAPARSMIQGNAECTPGT